MSLILICGPCVIESEELCMEVATVMSELCRDLGQRFDTQIDYYFKASFDKANRSSRTSFRGPGLYDGVEILGRVKEELGVKILTDVHEANQLDFIGRVADVIQIPALLCRQTDLIEATAATGKIINIKKGQFMAPHDMLFARQKAIGASEAWVTERGTTFGYHNLVVDMRSLVIMKSFGDTKVIFDATHSVQLPGGMGGSSSGQAQYARPLSRAAAAVGVDGFFFETHPNPKEAKSDGPNMIPLHDMEKTLVDILLIQDILK